METEYPFLKGSTGWIHEGILLPSSDRRDYIYSEENVWIYDLFEEETSSKC